MKYLYIIKTQIIKSMTYEFNVYGNIIMQTIIMITSAYFWKALYKDHTYSEAEAALRISKSTRIRETRRRKKPEEARTDAKVKQLFELLIQTSYNSGERRGVVWQTEW